MPPKAKRGKATSSKPQQSGVCFEMTFPCIEIMALALARFSAYIEDPQYENIPLAWAKAENIDLPAKRYAGHNFPLASFDECVSKLKGLNPLETIIVRAVKEAARGLPKESVYVIAYVAGDTPTFQHERQHALFYFNPEYQSRVAGIWNSTKVAHAAWASQFEEHLSKMYCSRVHVDEFQAIISNREYECVEKLHQLVGSLQPKSDEFGFEIKPIPLVLPQDKDAYIAQFGDESNSY